MQDQGLLTEDIEKIIKCCERLVILEQQTEQTEHQAQVEIPTNK